MTLCEPLADKKKYARVPLSLNYLFLTGYVDKCIDKKKGDDAIIALWLLSSLFQLSLGDEQCEVTRNGYESKELVYLVHIHCQVRNTSHLNA